MRRLLAILTLIPLLGLGCKNSVPPEASLPIKLNFWGVFDNEDAYGPLIRSYRAIHPNITVEYRKFRIEEYDRELLNAFAEDRGPDVFMVHHTSIPAWLPKITPLPPQITLPYWREEGTLKKETIVELVTNRSMTATDMRRLFPDVVGKDAIIPTLVDERTGAKADRIYGIPTAMDTLVLYYNKDLYSAAGIPDAPKEWGAFSDAVQKLTKLNPEGAILQSGAAIGTSGNIERSTDILSLLMMQSGAEMTDEFGFATFDKTPTGGNAATPPGVAATRFYTDFANPTRTTYTWSASLPNSFEAFATGKTAMMLGYNYHLPLLKARAPKLNFDIATVPQLNPERPVNYANYWMNTVSRKSRNVDAAWDFVQYIANAQNVTQYLAATGKPAALKSLAAATSEDPYLPMWNMQLLTARSWYRGKDVAAAETAMKELIDTYLRGGFENPNDPVRDAAQKVSQTMQ